LFKGDGRREETGGREKYMMDMKELVDVLKC